MIQTLLTASHAEIAPWTLKQVQGDEFVIDAFFFPVMLNLFQHPWAYI